MGCSTGRRDISARNGDGAGRLRPYCLKGGAHMTVQVNRPAPEFELSGVVGKEFRKVKLSDYKGKWVVLFFYPLDFTPV
jgi:hypothetical protein